MGNQQPVNGSTHPGGMPPDHQQRGGQGGVYPPGSYMPAPPPQGGSYPPNFDGAMQRTSSDTSMNMSDANQGVGVPGDGTGAQHQHAVNTNSSIENWLDDDTVPTVFRWEHGGRQVYITGTFNGWSRQIPMHRSGNDFTYIHNLKRGKHAFKFIVDDEWRYV